MEGSKHDQEFETDVAVYQNHKVFVQTPKSSTKVLKFFHGTFYCCVRYSNIEYEDENL